MKKIIAYTLLLGALNTVSWATQAETLSQALKTCGQIQNSLKRLVCYDKIVNDLNRYGDLDQLMSVPAPLPANGAASSAPQDNTQPRSASPAQPQSQPQVEDNRDFGMENRQVEERQDKIYATVVSITENARKKRVFTLDNQHVWRETEGNSMSVKTNDVIYIERGVMGSFHLSKDDVNRRIRVKRVK